jgi:2-dehydropantoate 2-reductase
MHIVIIGAGAMGSLLGYYLSARVSVQLLDGWQQHVDTINHEGLRLEREGHVGVRRVFATSDAAQIAAAEVAIVMVKAQQTLWAAEQARRVLHPDGIAVSLQNGVGNREQLASVLGAERAGQGVTSIGALLLGPGRVRQAGMGSTMFATLPDPARMAALAATFSVSGLPAAVSDDLEALVWGKLLVNVGINAISALLRVPNGALAEVPAVRTLVAQAIAEGVAVAEARGVQLPYTDALQQTLDVVVATAANRSSMLQDVLRGSPSEIATINGAIVREGERLGIPTPVNAILTDLMNALDATAERRIAGL